MRGKELHDFLFKLYDYADQLADKIQPENPDNGRIFIAIVLIEKFFDGIGRGEIHAAAIEAQDLDPRTSLAEAHRRIDLLRARISDLCKTYDFDDSLRYAGETLVTDWRRPKE